jgi:hypothetical protein
MKNKRKSENRKIAPGNPQDSINNYEESVSLEETKKFLKILEIQNDIIKKIIEPINNPSASKKDKLK